MSGADRSAVGRRGERSADRSAVGRPGEPSADREALRREIRGTLMPGFSGFETPGWIAEALGDGLLSVCIYGGNVRDAAQLRALGLALRAAGPDALIAIDEEGGEVTRLHYLTGAPYPGAAVLGRIDDLSYTEEVGARVARDILAAGFDLALAPDADVNSNPLNPVIGTRSFGADPELVARHVGAWIRGLQGEGAIACPKHFPGHGDTAQDSHLALPVVDAPFELVERRDLPPFRTAIEAGAGAVMTSHILLPQIDGSGPATFSRAILQGVLRDGLGFDGVILSDALDMRGASGGIGVPEAAVRALAAGCDLLCLGTDTTPAQLRGIEDRVLDAVASGELGADRVREAAARVRRLTRRPRGSGRDGAGPAPAGARGQDPAQELARIAESFDGAAEARSWLEAHPGAAVIRVDTEANMAVGAAPWGPFAAAEHPLPGAEAVAAAFLARRRFSADEDTAMPWPASALGGDGAIVVGRELLRHEFARDGIDSLRDAGVPVLTVDMGWAPPGVERGAYADIACSGSSALVGAALLTLIESTSS